MDSQSANPGRSRNQDNAICSAVSSVRGAADWNGSKGVLGSHVVLDNCRSRKQPAGVPGLLQQLSNTSLLGGTDTRQEGTTTGRESDVLSMAISLSRALSDTDPHPAPAPVGGRSSSSCGCSRHTHCPLRVKRYAMTSASSCELSFSLYDGIADSRLTMYSRRSALTSATRRSRSSISCTVWVSSLSLRPVTTLPSRVTARTELGGRIEPVGSSSARCSASAARS